MRNFQNCGIGLDAPGAVTITDNVIEQTSVWGMALGDAPDAEITNNVIRNETGICLSLPYPCDGMVIEGNDLYRGEGHFARTNDYWNDDSPVYRAFRGRAGADRVAFVERGEENLRIIFKFGCRVRSCW